MLYTHEHADHIHGIDDLRIAALRRRRRVPVHADAATGAGLRRRFGYCFETPPGSGYPPILDLHEATPGSPITVDGPAGPITATPFVQSHGDIDSLGYRIGGLAYSSDLNDLPAQSQAVLSGLDVWIIDALRWRAHPTHLSVDEAISWASRLKVPRAILTNLHMDLDYRTLLSVLPANVEPAYDGLRINIANTATT